jgi:hypothetical protein
MDLMGERVVMPVVAPVVEELRDVAEELASLEGDGGGEKEEEKE